MEVINMNIINFLKNNPNSRKIFGKRELKIIEKQLLGINLTQSEKNRLSRDIRKKFEFIRDASKFQDEFELKRASIIKNKIDSIKEAILKSDYFSKIKKIVLFGSTVENQRTFRSDIDISVEFYDTNIKEATEFRIGMNQYKDIDVQVYNVLPDKIKKQIDERGKTIYEKQDK